MKILRITSLGFESGGAENGIVLTDRELRKRGIEVRVLSSNRGREEGTFFADYTFTALSTHSFVLRALFRVFYPTAYREVKRVLREYKPDVIQLHTMYELSPSVLFALKGYPTVVTVHGAEDYFMGLLTWAFPKHFFVEGAEEFTKENLNIQGKFHYLFHKYCVYPVYAVGLRYTDTFLVMSEYMKELLAKEGKRAIVIPNATELFAYSKISAAAANLLYVGRLEKIKGVQVAIDALVQVREKRGDATLTIAGTGPYEHVLKDKVRELGLGEHVHFVGHVNRDRLYELYCEATVLLIPSLWPEPFGKVGIEAMSVGRPVVASDVGGVREWLTDSEVGYLVEKGNSKELAEKVLALVSDTSRLEHMSENARKQAEHYSIERYVDHIEKLYSLLKKRKQENLVIH